MQRGIIGVGNQLLELLDNIDDQAYQKPLPVFNGSTLGQHFRHIVNYFQCVHRGFKDEIIDYTLRERNILIETDTGYTRMVLIDILQQIETLDFQKHLSVKGDFNEANPDDRPVYGSTIGRELMFVYDHTIHHMAMIRIGLQSCFPEIKIENTVGMAPSTIRYYNGS